MNRSNRTKKSLLNIFAASFGSVIGIIISFLNRVVFLHYMNATYLGVSGLFSNILLIFSLAELGVGSALTQMFYKPFAEKEFRHLSQVAYTTKVLLNIVGFIIVALTIIITPCLELFVNDLNTIPHMRLIFFMYGISSSVTYFLGYYRTIITANQQAYKLVKIDNGWKVLAFSLKTIILALTKNFILYLLMDILLNIFLNITIKQYVQKQIPEIDYKIREFIPKEEQINLKKNVVGLSLNKLANIITNGTDNIIISKFLDLITVGLASNYILILQAVNGMIEAIFNPLLASIGNLCVCENVDLKYRHFNNFTFAAFWLYSFCSLTAYTLSDGFIELIFGKEYLIPRIAAFFVFFDLFCIGTFRVATLFKTAQGLFWYGKFRPLLQAIVNLIVSLILIIYTHKLWAVYAGTIASRIFITVWYEPLIVLKYGMNKKPREHYIKIITYFITYFMGLIIISLMMNHLPFTGLMQLIVGGVICVVVYNVIVLIIFFKTDEFQYWLIFTEGLVKKIRLRGHIPQ